MKIIGHRGSAGTALENTMESLQHGWQSGADGIEVDVHLSADCHVVVHHDKTTKRLSDQNIEVKSSSLQQLEQVSLQDSNNCSHAIPTLVSVFAEIAKQPVKQDFFIEIKSTSEMLETLAEVLPEDAADFITFISFRPEVITAAKQRFPTIPALYLLDTTLGMNFSTNIIEKAKACNADGLGVNYKGLTAKVAEAVKAEGLLLNVWTMNEESRLQEFADMGVDTCTTDYPKKFSALFKSIP